MVTLQQLQRNIHAYIKYLVDNPDTTIEIRYKGNAYQLSLDFINKEVPARINKKEELSIIEDKCSSCGGLLINNVCISDCVTTRL